MGNFSERLQYLRKRAGLTQNELADKVQISKSALSMYENGNREPNFETLERFADFFNVDMNFLTGRDAKQEYYLDAETAAKAQELFSNKELSLLFDAARDASAEDIQTIHTMLLALKKKEQ